MPPSFETYLANLPTDFKEAGRGDHFTSNVSNLKIHSNRREIK
jgi:hypothetical protein